MEILVIGSPNGNTANLLALNNCCKVRTERVGGRCLWGISSCLCAVEELHITYLSNLKCIALNLKWKRCNGDFAVIMGINHI